MYKVPVRRGYLQHKVWKRQESSSAFIRKNFIDYFTETHDHKHVKSSSVVPLYDPSVPFVNAGMNQFKGIFLGKVVPPHKRVVNSQKCVRVGGKHNDLEMVGVDGHHHTFFEMLGNWSFGDYYKKESCKMAWDLLLGPYRLKPENLMVTYFSGDIALGLSADTEVRDIWKSIGVPESKIKAMGARDNFWEMGTTGPCGPCTEIHYIHPDGSLTEIWNIVFIQCNRTEEGRVVPLDSHFVDTGMGLERITAIMQNADSNYDTDLFLPIIKAIEKHSRGIPEYRGHFGSDELIDCAYRRMADHARMVSICLADGVFPAASLNLKQIMRSCFKMSHEIFYNPQLLKILYSEVAHSLGSVYPELITKEADALTIIDHEREAYAKMKSGLVKKWKELSDKYPEVEKLKDVELSGFVQGYKDFKETMSKHKTNVMPGDLVFKLYDTHGFHENIINRVASVNNVKVDKQGFWKLLTKHKSKHKTALQEQGIKNGHLFNEAIKTLIQNGYKATNDLAKYDYRVNNKKIEFQPLKTKVIAILNEDLTWIDFLEACDNRPYYLVTNETNFYCEEGGQAADEGMIYVNNNVAMQVDSVFKIKDFVFHKGYFAVGGDKNKYVSCDSDVELEIDDSKRVKIMRNHTATHLLNAAVRSVLSNSVVGAAGSSVSDRGLTLTLSIYGEKLTQEKVMEIQELVRESIKRDATVDTVIMDSMGLSQESQVITIPGETYPEVGLRLVTIHPPLLSKELCCGTHVPTTGMLREFCVTLIKGAGSHTPVIQAVTGVQAEQVRELYWRAKKMDQVIEMIDFDRRKEEISLIRKQLASICGHGGAPFGEYAKCLALLDNFNKREYNAKTDMGLDTIAEAEIHEAITQASQDGRRFVVHFLRCSYMMQSEGVRNVLAKPREMPALVLGCAGGVVVAASVVPQDMVSSSFSAHRWLSCIAPVFNAKVLPTLTDPDTYAEMTATKVSLINCEQLVQDAMRVAIHFAKSHTKENSTEQPATTQNRQQN